MANNRIQIKRTSVSGRAANTTTLTNAGELALNMADGIMYSTNGSVVFEIGANNTNVNVSGNLTVKGIVANGGLGSSGQVLTSNGTSVYWSTASSGGFTNGQSISVNNFVLTGAFSANSSNGSSGNFLRSSGTSAYWSNVSILDVYYANGSVAYSATGNSLTTGITTGKAIAMAMIFGG